MGQQEVLDFLKEQKRLYPDKWWTATEIFQKINPPVSENSIRNSLKRLRNNPYIICEEHRQHIIHYLVYKYVER